MIDLEGLAVSRARALAQPEAEWLHPIQQSFVEQACMVLSDGEIEQIFELSESAVILTSLFESFAEAAGAGEENAFGKWKNHLAGEGLTPSQGAHLWPRLWSQQKKFSECLNAIKKKAVVGG